MGEPDIRFIRSRTGRVHLRAPKESEPEHVISSGEEFADAMLKGSRPRMRCGATMFVDWTESLSNDRAALPVGGGQFADEALCQRCMKAMGDQSHLVFEQIIEAERYHDAFTEQQDGEARG